jgi:hypothetical protein
LLFDEVTEVVRFDVVVVGLDDDFVDLAAAGLVAVDLEDGAFLDADTVALLELAGRAGWDACCWM